MGGGSIYRIFEFRDRGLGVQAYFMGSGFSDLGFLGAWVRVEVLVRLV